MRANPMRTAGAEPKREKMKKIRVRTFFLVTWSCV
jgi:hypothetical protein